MAASQKLSRQPSWGGRRDRKKPEGAVAHPFDFGLLSVTRNERTDKSFLRTLDLDLITGALQGLLVCLRGDVHRFFLVMEQVNILRRARRIGGLMQHSRAADVTVRAPLCRQEAQHFGFEFA